MRRSLALSILLGALLAVIRAGRIAASTGCKNRNARASEGAISCAHGIPSR
jgi:hypothetical protein